MAKDSAQTFDRKVFRTPRLADFASVPELIKQTGQPPENWPLVVFKELADNALDEAEQAGTAPEIEVAVSDNAITVADQGRGIAPALVEELTDYASRTSSKALYVSPTRGAQGNALQTILPMGFALAAEQAFDDAVAIESQGAAHRIGFAVDPLRQTPVVSYARERSAVKIGTRVTVRWPDSPRSIITDVWSGFLSLAENYGWLNPHLNLSLSMLGYDDQPAGSWKVTNPDWRKWRPSQPTSPRWYSVDQLNRLMAAYVADAEDRRSQALSVRGFIGLFRGLSGTRTAAAISAALGVGERETLREFHGRGLGAVARLQEAMSKLSQPVKPKALGVIGQQHLAERLVDDGCDPDGIVYRKREMMADDGLPYVIEAAFGYRPDADEAEYGLRVVEGFNFSPAVGGSPFLLEARLAENRVDDGDPVTVVLHLTTPRFNFLDRGKSRVALSDEIDDEVEGLVKAVTAKWTKQKTAEIRDAQARMRRAAALTKRDTPMKQTAAAGEVMAEAYLKAAGGVGKANPRQIFYVARPLVEAMTGRPLVSKYFTQTLLIDYIAEHQSETADWDIIWDDRGHFREPHTGYEIGLGTEAVRDYIAEHHDPETSPVEIAAPSVVTRGPAGRYGAVLYIEKEGFDPIIEAAGIPARFDLAPTSSKGMSVTACRMLVEELCGRLGLPLCILHDFDFSGFSIKQTLFTSNRRYTFRHPIKTVFDLGLRLADVERLGLAAETVVLPSSKAAIASRLRVNGATKPEIDFLLSGEGKLGHRVELNAMTSDQFVAFVEDKLSEHGVAKVTPDAAMLADTFTALKRHALAREALAAELTRFNAAPVDVPADLHERVDAYLAVNPTATWDDAVLALVEADQR